MRRSHCLDIDRHSTGVQLTSADNTHIGDDVTPLRERDAGDICGSRSWRSKAKKSSGGVDAMVTAVCVTMGVARSADLLRMLLSFRELYPRMAMVIVSAGIESSVVQPSEDLCLAAKQVRKIAGVKALHAVPPTANLSALRNIALRYVRTSYALVLDDDFVFTNRSRVDALLTRALENDVDVVAGFVQDERQCHGALNSPKCRPGRMITVPTKEVRGKPIAGWALCDCLPSNGCALQVLESAEHPGCIRATYVRQFFLARTDALVTVGWDDSMPFPDHWMGMWRLRLANARMLWCDATVAAINHVPGIRHFEVTRNLTRQDTQRFDRAELETLLPHGRRIAEVFARNRVVHGLHSTHRYVHPLPNLVSDRDACAAALDAARCPTSTRGHRLAVAATTSRRAEGIAGCTQDSSVSTSEMSQQHLGSLLKHKWLLFVGDSALRMMFHLVLGALTLGWIQWPLDPNVTFSARLEPENASCLQTYSWLTANESHAGCLEDVFVRQWGCRLTMTWVDFNDDPAWLDPLRSLLQQSVGLPDAVVVAIGAWFAKAPGGRRFPQVGNAYQSAMETLLGDVEHSLDQRRPARYFRPAWPSSTRLIFAGTSYCTRKIDRAMQARVAEINQRARQVVAARAGYHMSAPVEDRPPPLTWKYVDRQQLTHCEAECVGAGFHVIGDSLNRVSMALLEAALGH